VIFLISNYTPLDSNNPFLINTFISIKFSDVTLSFYLFFVVFFAIYVGTMIIFYLNEDLYFYSYINKGSILVL
jgi:hypothetical protein